MHSLLPLRSLSARLLLMCAALLVLGVSAQPDVALRYERCASAVDLSRGVDPRGPGRDPSAALDGTDRQLRCRIRPAMILPDIHPLGLSGDGQPHDLRGCTLPSRLSFSTGT